MKNVQLSVELNGPSTLTFELPAKSEKRALLNDIKCRVRVDGREYCLIDPTEDVREDKLVAKIEMSESWTLLGRHYKTIGTTPLAVIALSSSSYGGYEAGSAASVLYALLEGTEWVLGTIDVTGKHDLETEKLTILENIHEVQKLWGGWLVWDSVNKILHLRNESLWQVDNGYTIQYKKNQKVLKKITKWDSVVTKLYPFGEKDLSIGTVNDGVIYLENYSYTTDVREGIKRWEEIEDPAKLKETATEYLAKYCQPLTQYQSEVVDLRVLPEYSHETFSVGNIVTIQDEDLADNVKVRIIAHSYDVIQPWKCSFTLGDPFDDPLEPIRQAVDMGDYVENLLRRSEGVSSLTKGLINTFTTIINSANGKAVWEDDTLTFIEVDALGSETGKRMRLTPGGLGISKDSGQTYVTAITGEGILANRIVISDTHALTSEDTHTVIGSSGLRVYDSQSAERVLLGYWNDGTDHYGLKIKNDKGDVLIDDRGILQTWQEGRADNIDADNPLMLYVYIPSETVLIKNAILRIKLLPFRAYSKSIRGGGGGDSTTTSGASSSTSSGPSSSTTTGSGVNVNYLWMDTRSAGDPPHTHQHYWVDSHAHNMPHTHSIAHTHTVSVYVSSHTHGIDYGIYLSTTPTGITVKINNVDRTSALGGPFNTDKNGIDIMDYLTLGQWNEIAIGGSGLGRIDASVFLQALMSSS